MSGIDPELHRQLVATLRRCDAFASHAELRNVFVDGRLSPWQYNVPEAGSTYGRVQAVITFLHDKANVRGENALLLLLQVLQERYDPTDAYYGELSALIAALGGAPSPRPTPGGDIYTPYEARMRELLARLGKDHPRYGEALVYQQRLEENLAAARRYDDPEDRRAERAEIVNLLNTLSLKTLGVAFNDLGGASAATDVQAIVATSESDRAGIEGALQKARRMLAHLETQAAGYTSLTIPAHLQIELEDQRKKVVQLEAQVAALKK